MKTVTIKVTVLALTLILPLSYAEDAQCTSNGFFRQPDDCTRFYRCVDLTGQGYFQKYTFSCPVGTVFDENLSVCNHPWAAPPCNSEEGEEEMLGGAGEEQGGSENENEQDGDDSVSTCKFINIINDLRFNGIGSNYLHIYVVII